MGIPTITYSSKLKRLVSDYVKGLVFTSLTTLCLGVSAQTYPAHSVLAAGSWHRLAFERSGVCKVSVSDVPGLSGAECDKVAVYGNGGGLMDMLNSAERPNDLRQIAISIYDQNGNGRMDGGDYLLFYAECADVWKYNSQSGMMEHQRHPYAKYNYYYITANSSATPKRIATATATEANTNTITNYTSTALLDNDITNTHGTGQIWVGEKFTTTTTSRNFTLTLPGVTSGSQLRARVALASISTGSSQFSVTYGGSTQRANLNPNSPYVVLRNTYNASSASANFNISYSYSENHSTGYLDFIELNATSPLTFRGGQAEIYNLEHLGAGNVAQFSIGSATSAMRVWDVSRNDSVVEMVLTRNGSTATFCNPVESAGHYVMFDGNSYISPLHVTQVTNQDLHGESGADLVILSHPTFLSQAQELANLHLIYDGISSLVVTPEKVWNEFSSGKQDPIAVREMLRMFYKRAAQDDGTTCPKYLLLFGCGTFDNKDILANGLPQILTCQSETSFTDEGGSYCTDDLFGYLDDGERGSQNESLEVSIGRLPARNTAEADHLVAKIRRYLEKSDLKRSEIRGDWRNYITLLADDADPSSPGDSVFASSSENIARRINADFPHMNIDKIYADAYTQQSSAIGSYYPDVNNALRQRLDYGCLLFNYIGHGSVEYIGTERYIELNDITNYSNRDQLALFVTSTCSYGRFDKLSPTSGSELLLHADGGAIGVITASRPIGHIEKFDRDICLNALTAGNTMGDALRLAKNATSVSHSFVLLGDPALKLSLPENKVVVDEINGSEVTEGVCDSAEVLSKVIVKGEIRDSDGAKLSNFNGTLYATVFDRPTATQTQANDNEGTEVRFTQQNSVIYRGHTTVTAGEFEYSFIVPRDVSPRYDRVKLSHFAKSDDERCATGSHNDLMIGGFNQDADLTECRPQIDLYINDSAFHNGGITDENPTIYARLSDKVGINAVGSGIGHNITAVLDGNANSEITLNDFYETDLNDSRCGQVVYGLTNLTPGVHSLTLKAWNIYNFSNEATITFVVRSDDSISLGRCYAYPNPSNSGTTLHIEHNKIEEIESVSIDIMSSIGQTIRSLTPITTEGSYVITAPWDMRSADGTEVANGMYIARIVIRTKDGQKELTHAKIIKVK
ncbi:MAG: type IX secretion system sortase PorU [Bacteroidales bacterium]|nr:type IX secretion system sortase PorU [Bacteroidales bacterium]